jgi:hypothetical protein
MAQKKILLLTINLKKTCKPKFAALNLSIQAVILGSTGQTYQIKYVQHEECRLDDYKHTFLGKLVTPCYFIDVLVYIALLSVVTRL